MNHRLTPYIYIIAILLMLFACNDDERFTQRTDAKVAFSVDTISFDTVFTTIGSSTKTFLVYNPNKEGIRLADIRLGSNGTSGFRLNVDGQHKSAFTDVEIYGGDSIFVFIEVTVNPQDADSPVLITDSIVFTLENGHRQYVQLNAYGQNVHIVSDAILTEGAAHFLADRPYLIMDSLVVPEGITMTATPGAMLCFHKGAGLEVYGRLNLEGTTQKPIILRGDRTDRMFTYLPYDRLDGQWQGIHLHTQSTQNHIANADIHGSQYGIICDSTGIEALAPKLSLWNSCIHNVAGPALKSTSNRIFIANSQLSNAATTCLDITGGSVEIHFSTISQFYPWAVSEEALYVTNHIGDTAYPLYQFLLANSIITGSADDVILGSCLMDTEGNQQTDIPFNLMFYHSLLRTDTVGMSQFLTNCIIEYTDSTFCSAGNFKTIDTQNYIYDFHLDSLSLARGIADTLFNERFSLDRVGRKRKKNPDAGCYEY